MDCFRLYTYINIRTLPYSLFNKLNLHFPICKGKVQCSHDHSIYTYICILMVVDLFTKNFAGQNLYYDFPLSQMQICFKSTNLVCFRF